jgi:hypothetical protein
MLLPLDFKDSIYRIESKNHQSGDFKNCAPKGTCSELFSDPQIFMELVRFDQKSMLSELPVNLEKVGRDVRHK